MRWKKRFRIILSVSILLLFGGLLVATIAISVGIIDLKPDPEVHAEYNTTGVPAVNTSKHPDIDGRVLEREIFDTVNERRVESGVDPLIHSERIRLIARLHSAEMAKRGFFDHTNPAGVAPPGRHESYDGCERPNENIAVLRQPATDDTRGIAKKVVLMWSNSEGHNNSMMTSYDKVSGVGVYVTKNMDIYVTQNFCREHPNA